MGNLKINLLFFIPPPPFNCCVFEPFLFYGGGGFIEVIQHASVHPFIIDRLFIHHSLYLDYLLEISTPTTIIDHHPPPPPKKKSKHESTQPTITNNNPRKSRQTNVLTDIHTDIKIYKSTNAGGGH